MQCFLRKAGQKSPGIFAFRMQSLRSRISPKQWVFSNAKPPLRTGGLPLGERHAVQESPPHGFRPLKEGWCRLLAEPTPSPRLCIRSGATPRGPDQTIMTLRAARSKAELLTLHKSGTSHFALTDSVLASDYESPN